MKVSEKLLEAKTLIINHGWRQGGYGGPTTGFCAAGAINWVFPYYDDETFTKDVYSEARRYMERAVEKRKPFCTLQGVALIAYNDDIGRTKEEILVIFDEALALAEAEQR